MNIKRDRFHEIERVSTNFPPYLRIKSTQFKMLKEFSNQKVHEPNGTKGHVQEISFLEILIFENYLFELKYLGATT